MHTLVLMSGGFHPFHPGHFALYNAAKNAFPGADVVVGATNVTKDRPFDFKDKATLAQIAGVEPGHFVEVKRQFAVAGEPNIENRIQNPQDTILILVRSEKDAQDPKLQPWRLNPDGSVPMTKGTKNHPPKPTSNYLLPYVGNQKKLKPMTEHAYIAFLPVHEFGANDMTSATEIRNEWPTLDEKGKMNRAISLYPATQKNPKLLKTVVNILNKNLSGELPTVTPNIKPTVQPNTNAVKKLKANPLKENLLKVIQTARPMLKEASVEQKLKLMKLLKESLSTMAYSDLHPADELAHRLKKLSSQQLDYDNIDKMMKEISHKYGLDPTGKKLHVMFATKYGHNPDYWIKKIKNPVTEMGTEQVNKDIPEDYLPEK